MKQLLDQQVREDKAGSPTPGGFVPFEWGRMFLGGEGGDVTYFRRGLFYLFLSGDDDIRNCCRGFTARPWTLGRRFGSSAEMLMRGEQ